MSIPIHDMEQALLTRLSAALTLPEQAHPKIDVAAWPDRPANYKMVHPHGAALLIYKGTKYSSLSTAGQAQDASASFEIGLIARMLREPNLDPAVDPLSVGMYALIRTVTDALMGWRVPASSAPLRMVSDAFTDYNEGTWSYTLSFVVPCVVVLDATCPTGPWVGTSCIDSPPLVQRGFVYEPSVNEILAHEPSADHPLITATPPINPTIY